MRFHFANLNRPKQAAKNLARLEPGLKLSAVQEALSHVLGYRDWHELSISAAPTSLAADREADANETLRIIADLADALGLPESEVQYAISKARLLWNAPLSLDDHQALCAKIWRNRLFGPPKRGKPGTVVKDKAYGANAPAYLLRTGRASYLLFDTGIGVRANFEVLTPRNPLPDFVPSRLWLPYGHWTLQDGSEVIFSRNYYPMWRVNEGRVERLDPWLWINGIAAVSHFGTAATTGLWASGPAREMALQHLARHRIFELPKLVGVMPHLFEADVDEIPEGVVRMYEVGGANRTLPDFATLNTRLLGDRVPEGT